MGELAEPRIGRPRDARLDEAIVDATIALLEERGYNDLSLAAIAERAGTTTAAIYRRWGSKSELVTQAVFRTEGDDVVADTDDLAADLSTMVHWAVEKICRPAAVAAVVGLLGESRQNRALRSLDATLASRRVEERLDRAKATGELRADIDTSVLAAMISGPVILTLFTGRARQVDDDWISDLVTVVLDGARNGPPSSPSPSRTRTASRSERGARQ